MDIEQNLIEIVKTTENTYLVYKNIASKLLIYDLEYLNKTLEELSNQQLIDKYLQVEKEDGSFYYRYKKGVDDRFIKKIGDNKDSYDNWCTIKWVDRKIEELKSLLIKNGRKTENKNEKIPSFQKGLKISEEQLDKLFLALNEMNLIKENNSELFKQCFLGGKLEKQPQIKFYEQPQILYYLFKLMHEYIVIIDDENLLFLLNKKHPTLHFWV